MVYDWHATPPPPPARLYDARTGQPVHGVFRYCTATHALARYQTGPDGLIACVEGTDLVATVTEFRELRVEFLEAA